MENHRTSQAQKQALADHELRLALLPMFAKLQDALIEKPFRPHAAALAHKELSAAWDPTRGGSGGWAHRPWVGMVHMDAGQCDNAHARLSDLRPPMMAATRWGSAESIAWLCTQPEFDPVVKFVDLCDFWAPKCAATSGIVGAWEPLWASCKARGWSASACADAYSTWLIGCVEGSLEWMPQALGVAAPALAELRAGDPDFKVPLSPASCAFSCALDFAMCQDPDEMTEIGTWDQRALILLSAVPIEMWRHESQWEDLEALEGGEGVVRRPSSPLNFIESALTIGHLPVLHHLSSLGFAPPPRTRLFELLPKEEGQAPEHKQALDWALGRLAVQERDELDVFCVPSKHARPARPL